MIRISEDYLKARPRCVQRMLRPLRNRELACQILPGPYGGTCAIAAHDGLERETYEAEAYRSCSFTTIRPGIRGRYFELWLPDRDRKYWALERAYLTIYRVDIASQEPMEMICLHCDPLTTEDEPLRTYKRGPHLHVEVASDPWPDCHFAMCLSSLDKVMSTSTRLTRAFGSIVQMIRSEVLTRL